MISVVTRPFRGDAPKPYDVGAVLDTTTWRLERQLHEQRYLRQANAEEIAAFRGTAPKAAKASKETSKKTPQAPGRGARKAKASRPSAGPRRSRSAAGASA